MTNCKKCNSETSGNYCSHCGLAVNLKRIDGHYLMHEIEHVLHFEKGFLYTFKELLIRPGAAIKLFFTENRGRLVKPIIFIIITSLIYTIIMNLFNFDLTVGKVTIININGTLKGSTAKIFNWIQTHLGYSNIYFGIFIAFWLKVLFRKYEYNYFELLILLCFLLGFGMLIHSVTTLILGFTKINLLKLGGELQIIYTCWAIGQFFNKSKALSYAKALLSYILGMISSFAMLFLIGYLIDGPFNFSITI